MMLVEEAEEQEKEGERWEYRLSEQPGPPSLTATTRQKPAEGLRAALVTSKHQGGPPTDEAEPETLPWDVMEHRVRSWLTQQRHMKSVSGWFLLIQVRLQSTKRSQFLCVRRKWILTNVKYQWPSCINWSLHSRWMYKWMLIVTWLAACWVVFFFCNMPLPPTAWPTFSSAPDYWAPRHWAQLEATCACRRKKRGASPLRFVHLFIH